MASALELWKGPTLVQCVWFWESVTPDDVCVGVYMCLCLSALDCECEPASNTQVCVTSGGWYHGFGIKWFFYVMWHCLLFGLRSISIVRTASTDCQIFRDRRVWWGPVCWHVTHHAFVTYQSRSISVGVTSTERYWGPVVVLGRVQWWSAPA